MKTAQFYKYATWLLLALNLLVIAFFFFTQPGPPRGKHRQHFRKEALNILQLSNEQKAAFVASADTHNKAMNTLGEQENSLLKSYFEALMDTTQRVNQASLMAAVLELEKAKIEGTFQHFSEVKNMLNDSQSNEFEFFMRRALGILLLDQQKNTPPPKD
jgi:hypothetical protein